MRENKQGYSLVEMLIAVAILAILATSALPLYSAYISTSNMTRVNANYETAMTFVQRTYKKAFIDAALGNTPVIPETTDDWITLLNPGDVTAPGGGPAFRIGDADPSTGQIGILAEGAFPLTARVLLERPGYDDLSTELTIIAASEMAK